MPVAPMPACGATTSACIRPMSRYLTPFYQSDSAIIPLARDTLVSTIAPHSADAGHPRLISSQAR
jgi:hypothetical protein